MLRESGMGNYYDLNTFPGAKQTRAGDFRYEFLDLPDIQQQLLEFSSGIHATITLELPGIHCSSCVWLLENLYRLDPGVRRSEVNFLKKEAHIHYNPEEISLRQLAELVDRIGYQPRFYLAQDGKAAKATIDRSLWYRTGIAGFCFGNIMLLSFPEYLALEGFEFSSFFGHLNLVLVLPVVLYASRDYFKSAWKGLKQGFLNMDVPISLGIAVLFLRSGFEILSHIGPGYLDSLSGLVFFLLLGKIYQDKTHHALSFERDYQSYFPIAVTRVSAGEQVIPLAEAKPGDNLLIRHGELIPADAILLKGEGRIDYSFVTGESEPVLANPGERLFAGGRQHGGAIQVQITGEVKQSYLTRLWNNEAFRKQKESQATALSNQVGRIFTPIIVFLAFAAGVYWWIVEPGMAFNVFSAVLIVACPCALALSTPFTMGTAIRILSREGFFLKGPSVVEALSKVKTIIFDKTGTITRHGEVAVEFKGEKLNGNENQVLLAFFHQSAHPLSRSITTFLQNQVFEAGSPEEIPNKNLELSAFKEEKGQGIQAKVGENQVKAGSASFVTGFANLEKGKKKNPIGAEVYISIDEQYKGYFVINFAYREGIGEMLNQLGNEYELAMLSGDNEKESAAVKMLFPGDTEIRFRQQPVDKLDFVKAKQVAGKQVMMVGDGLNDAGALKQSEVGVSVAEDLLSFTPASDVIVSGKSLRELPRFLRFSKASINVIRASFGISFAYNVVGLAFAMSGNLSPLVAAILMPASSVTVIVFTTLATRAYWK